MIYRGVKITWEEEKKKVWRNWLKAVGYAALGVAVVAAVVLLTGQLGL